MAAAFETNHRVLILTLEFKKRHLSPITKQAHFLKVRDRTNKEAPRDPDRAFLAFFRSFAENNPLAK